MDDKYQRKPSDPDAETRAERDLDDMYARLRAEEDGQCFTKQKTKRD
jgi:hypothetical protein